MKKNELLRQGDIVSLLKQMSAMDQATTQEEQHKIAPELLKAMAEYADAENIVLYRKKEKNSDVYIPIIDWKRQVKFNIDREEILLSQYASMNEYFGRRKSFFFKKGYDKNNNQKEQELLGNFSSVMFVPILALKQLCGFLKLENISTPLSIEKVEVLNSIASHWGAVYVGMRVISSQSERSKKAEKILETEKQYSNIMSALSRVYWQIYIVDLEADIYREVSDGRRFDKNAVYHVGITAKEFHNTLEKFVSEKYRKEMQMFLNHSTLRRRLQNTETISIEYLATNGIWLSARYIVQKRDKNGIVQSALFAIRSIDEHKQKEIKYQEKLKEIAEEAKRANIAKTDFLRRMSHDLRTPINGIRGMLEISDRNAEDIEKLKDCRKKMWSASQYLLNLINDVLDMNRLESGKISLEETPFDMKEIWRDVDDVIGTQANEKGIAVVTGIHKVRHTKLIGSPLYLRQILMNIGNNAVKYTNAGGTITISCVEKQLTDKKVSYSFVIADNGIGMSKEFQKHAYEVFSQEHSEVAGGYVGTGLGLAITKQLVDLLKGTIEFESKPGQGTTFVIELPFFIDFSKKNSIEERKIEQCDLTGKKFLLVEDNELNMEISKYILEEEGVVVDTALNGKQAVEMFSKSKEDEYSLIFMDIMMPVMNGYEATKIIRNMGRKDSMTIPIFAMSANAFPEDIRESKKAGMNEHLSKPIETQTLLKAIYTVIKK